MTDLISKALTESRAVCSASDSADLLSAADRLEGLAERWEQTECWHNPPFLEGKICITTSDLRDIAELVRHVQDKCG